MSQLWPSWPLPIRALFPLFGPGTWERRVSARAHNPALGTLSHMALLTLQEIEKIFKISRSTLYRMRNEGGFPPGIQVRGRWRWKAIDIQAFIERSKATSSRESCMVSPQYQGAVARGPRRLRVA